MADHEATDTLQTVAQRYAPALISFAVLVIGAVQTAAATGPFSLVVILQLISLAAGSGLTYFLPVVGTKWRGKLKTGVELLTVLIALALPYAIVGHITGPEVLLVVIGVIKAIGTELGVAIRVDPAVAPVLPVATLEAVASSKVDPVVTENDTDA